MADVATNQLSEGAVAREPGKSSWRSEVLRQARRLNEELDEVPNSGLVDAEARQIFDHISERIKAAEEVANRPYRLRDWWTGAAVEEAWDHVQTGREMLDLVEPESRVRAQIPVIQARLEAQTGDAPDVHKELVTQLQAIREGTGLSMSDRQRVRAIRERLRLAQDDHAESRQFRNNLVILSVLAAVVATALAIVEKTGGLYALIGAGCGILTTALTWRSLTKLTGPYSVNTAQAMLKIPVGALTALLGVLIASSGAISGLSANGSALDGYAIVFGLSQQALTQVVDSAAKNLGEGS